MNQEMQLDMPIVTTLCLYGYRHDKCNQLNGLQPMTIVPTPKPITTYARALLIYLLTIGTIGIVNKLLKQLKNKCLWWCGHKVGNKGAGPSIPLGRSRVIRTPILDSFLMLYSLGSMLDSRYV